MRPVAQIRELLARPLASTELLADFIVEPGIPGVRDSRDRARDVVEDLRAWRDDARGLLDEVGRLALRDGQVVVPLELIERTLDYAAAGCSPTGAKLGDALGELRRIADDQDEAIGHAAENPPARPHLVGGEFQSDKYPTTPRGKVPLSVKDPTAQDLLWEYAQRRRAVDADFSADLETALRNAGYQPGEP